jgi:1-aminocyclopropane-1-carboxylate deaminase/D-cysteine desulfhydrase-like pyridoxal-dependent ACC family enzyme
MLSKNFFSSIASPIEQFSALGKNFYIKREDLLGGLFNGTKNRKIPPILEKIKTVQPRKVILKGSFYSNFLIAFIPHLKALSIPFEIYTTAKYQPNAPIGNYFFLHQLVEKKDLHFVESYPLEFPPDIFVIEEGGDCLEAYLGLLTLGDEIKLQMKQNDLFFTDIWIDAGTGTTAICLLYAMMMHKLPITLHIVSMKDSLEEFLIKQKKIFTLLNEKNHLQITLDALFKFYHPPTAKSFGSTNKKVFQTIKEVAFSSGIFLDPIYSAKLFLTAKETNLDGTILFIHSGGTLSLTGFANQFKDKEDQVFDSNNLDHNHTSTACL